MGLYRRDDSPYWWMALSAPGRRPTRTCTKIPVDAPSREARADLKRTAELVFVRAQATHVLEVRGLAPRPAISVAKFLSWYETHVAAHHKGVIRARSMLKQLRAKLGELELSALTRDRILEWRSARVREVSPSTVNRELDVLKAALSHAVPTYLEASPARGLPRLAHRAPTMRILSREDETTLLAVLEPADRAIVIAALDTLARAGDLLRLTWSDDHGPYLTIRDPKTGHPYDVPISRRLRAALDALPKTGPYIFGHRRPTNGRSVELYRMMVEAGKRAGLKVGRAQGITFHGLRHTGASRLVAAGVDLRTVQALGGWRSLRQLSRYSHPTDAHLLAAVEAIGRGVAFTSHSRGRRPSKKSA